MRIEAFPFGFSNSCCFCCDHSALPQLLHGGTRISRIILTRITRWTVLNTCSLSTRERILGVAEDFAFCSNVAFPRTPAVSLLWARRERSCFFQVQQRRNTFHLQEHSKCPYISFYFCITDLFLDFHTVKIKRTELPVFPEGP